MAADPRKVAVVGCYKQKRAEPGPAREVYCSRHFRVALAWAERHCGLVLIASTKLGLIRPDAVIEPYDQTFSRSAATAGAERFVKRARAGVYRSPRRSSALRRRARRSSS